MFSPIKAVAVTSGVDGRFVVVKVLDSSGVAI